MPLDFCPLLRCTNDLQTIKNRQYSPAATSPLPRPEIWDASTFSGLPGIYSRHALLVGLISPSSVVTKLWLPGSPGRIVLAAWWTSASGVNVNCLAEAEGRLPGVAWLARNRTTSRLGCGTISRLLLRCFPRQMTGVGCEPARGSPERSRRAGEAGLAGTGLPNVVPAPKDTDGFTGQPRQCRRPAPAGRQHRDQDDGQRRRENTQARCFLSPSMAQACPEPVLSQSKGSPGDRC